jgi:hypothetical protein
MMEHSYGECGRLSCARLRLRYEITALDDLFYCPLLDGGWLLEA